MVSVDQARQLLGLQVVDTAGDKVGTVSDVSLNDQTGQLSWVTVASGWFGLSESSLPLNGARIDDQRIRVPFDKATIKNAPRLQSGVPLTPQDEDQLSGHYNIPIASVAARGTTENGANTTGYAAGRGREVAMGGRAEHGLGAAPVGGPPAAYEFRASGGPGSGDMSSLNTKR